MIGALSYSKADRVVRQSEKRVLSDTINRIDISLNAKVRQIDSLMQTVAGSMEAQELANLSESGVPSLVSTAVLSQLCQNLFGPFGEISAVNIMLGGQVIYTSRVEDAVVDPVMLAELYDHAGFGPTSRPDYMKRMRKRQKACSSISVCRAPAAKRLGLWLPKSTRAHLAGRS